MLLKELPVPENEAQASARESRASQGATNGCDEVAHPAQVHTALSKMGARCSEQQRWRGDKICLLSS